MVQANRLDARSLGMSDHSIFANTEPRLEIHLTIYHFKHTQYIYLFSNTQNTHHFLSRHSLSLTQTVTLSSIPTALIELHFSWCASWTRPIFLLPPQSNSTQITRTQCTSCEKRAIICDLDKAFIRPKQTELLFLNAVLVCSCVEIIVVWRQRGPWSDDRTIWLIDAMIIIIGPFGGRSTMGSFENRKERKKMSD